MNDSYMDALSVYAGTDNHYACGCDEDGKIINLDWYADNPKAKPTTAQLDAIIISLKTEYDKNKYQRDRKRKYPDMGDQLDALYHAGAFPEDMAAKLKAVKDEFPKE